MNIEIVYIEVEECGVKSAQICKQTKQVHNTQSKVMRNNRNNSVIMLGLHSVRGIKTEYFLFCTTEINRYSIDQHYWCKNVSLLETIN